MTLLKNKMQHDIYRPVVLALVLLVLGLAPVALAQPADPGNRPEHAGPPQDVVDMLLDRGFQQIQPSIFERAVEEGFSYETVVYGVDGHLWLLGQQEAFLETLQARYEAFPAVELLDAILAQEERIAGTRARIDEMMDADNTSGSSLTATNDGLTSVRLGAEEVISVADAATCTTNLSRSGNAGPGSTGPTASGSASFSDSCTETGTVSSTATAQGTNSSGNIVSYTDTCPSSTGGNVSCSASASVDAVSNCFSNGQGDVTFGFFTYTVSRTNFTCRILTASLSGTTYLYVPRYSTRYGSWSVSASGGTTPYNYQWFFNNSPVGGNSTSYSRGFTHPGYGGTVYYSVKVTVTDSSSPSQAVTKTLSVRVVYESGSCDPCTEICPVITSGEDTGWGTAAVIPEPCLEDPTL